ncbi:MAG TPA: aromatic ring-hydroxylating dioxygenase subunit alpha [Gemmatimonadaceae bacterium]|nr:aromatic ring-hydroxylating dioxygenase subunit alpha [Gemmatimonadaceae bacterium]
MTAFLRTVDSYLQGARTLPQRYYLDPDVLAAEWTRLFGERWLCVGRADQVAKPGSYIVANIGVESVIVVRDRKTQRLHAHFNVCRHRGTRICMDAAGTFGETIQCPYHAWTYALDGSLLRAPMMQEAEDFERERYALVPADVAEWEGFVFLNLARDPEPFEDAFGPVLQRFSRYNISRLTTVRRIQYDVQANWKLILQNYNECLHCPTIHPMLSKVLPYTSGANDLIDGPFLGGYMEIAQPNESATVSGRTCGPLVGDLSGDDLHRAYYYSLFPNMMLSMHPDYVVSYMVWPVHPTASHIVSDWLFHPDAVAHPDFDPTGAIEFWDVTNRQDWAICEQSQLGVRSRAYTPGPYSPRESIPAAWDRTYLKAMGSDFANR